VQTPSWHAYLGFWFTRNGNATFFSETSLNHTLYVPEGWKQTGESTRNEDDFHLWRKTVKTLIEFISGPNEPPPPCPLSSVSDRPVTSNGLAL
jgi:hypothetical protein